MLAAFSLSLAVLLPQSNEPPLVPPLVPQPNSVQVGEGRFELRAATRITFGAGGEAQARLLADELHLLTGLRLAVVPRGNGNTTPDVGAIELRLADPKRDVDLEEERGGYELFANQIGVRLDAASTQGMAHATATLLQLVAGADGTFGIPSVFIEDEPSYAFRTVMIDVARNPHSIAVLEDVVRLAHLYKLRFVHLHLTDNQLFTFPFAPVTDELKSEHVYTRAQLEGLVRYAAVRGITLIPEIDLPGHSVQLRKSGYLPGAENDRDVADAKHFERIAALLNAVMDVFDSSPYFHIGGDESGAGNELLPFLGRVQKLVRGRGKRLIVWEGFHGAPTDILPPTGPDRVIVAAWESSYNAPWDLLQAGYELINASWKPLYVVGGGGVVHPGSTGGRKWMPRELAQWDPTAFWHWEPGRPVFEDRGPNDPDTDDQTWNARWIGRERQIIGSQMSVWEQRETSVTNDLRLRLPVFAERVWRGSGTDVDGLLERVRDVDDRVFGIVQPVDVAVAESHSPLRALFEQLPADGLRLRNRLGVGGTIRYSLAPFDGSPTWLSWGEPEDPIAAGADYTGPIRRRGGFAVRAQLTDADGKAVPGTTWMRFQDWPSRVRVQEFDVGSRTPQQFPDFAAFVVRDSYELPMLRGPIRHNRVVGQRFSATLRPPQSGEFTLSMKTQSGRARLWLDVDGDGLFAADEEVITETPTTEQPQSTKVTLAADRVYALRIDHVSGLPRPVVIATLEGPGIQRRTDISEFLVPLH